jgi:processive 1,2-diacylglycerol beta-glucosyltransferase
LDKFRELKTRHQLYAFGFVDNIEVLMDAADCIVTKPSGLTVTEALSKRLPMILVNAIPGQEENNIDFLLNNGLALHVNKRFSIAQAVYYLFLKPDRLTIMRQNMELYSHADSTDKLCDFIIGLAEKKHE